MLHQRRRADGRGFFRRPDWTARRSPPLSGLVLTTWEGLFLERAVSDRPDVLLRNATLSVVVGRRQSDPYGGLRGRSLSTLGIWVCVCVCVRSAPGNGPGRNPPIIGGFALTRRSRAAAGRTGIQLGKWPIFYRASCAATCRGNILFVASPVLSFARLRGLSWTSDTSRPIRYGAWTAVNA